MEIKYIFSVAILAFLISCKPEINEFEPGSGQADFTSYVAVGNSLTAGYADGALYKSGQQVGWANIIAQQLKTVGVHFSPQGNALIANLFIKEINKKYGSKIPEVLVSEYSGMQFPFCLLIA